MGGSLRGDTSVAALSSIQSVAPAEDGFVFLATGGCGLSDSSLPEEEADAMIVVASFFIFSLLRAFFSDDLNVVIDEEYCVGFFIPPSQMALDGRWIDGVQGESPCAPEMHMCIFFAHGAPVAHRFASYYLIRALICAICARKNSVKNAYQ
jgi:hypothetical protein